MKIEDRDFTCILFYYGILGLHPQNQLELPAYTQITRYTLGRIQKHIRHRALVSLLLSRLLQFFHSLLARVLFLELHQG